MITFSIAQMLVRKSIIQVMKNIWHILIGIINSKHDYPCSIKSMDVHKSLQMKAPHNQKIATFCMKL